MRDPMDRLAECYLDFEDGLLDDEPVWVIPGGSSILKPRRSLAEILKDFENAMGRREKP